MRTSEALKAQADADARRGARPGAAAGELRENRTA